MDWNNVWNSAHCLEWSKLIFRDFDKSSFVASKIVEILARVLIFGKNPNNLEKFSSFVLQFYHEIYKFCTNITWFLRLLFWSVTAGVAAQLISAKWLKRLIRNISQEHSVQVFLKWHRERKWKFWIAWSFIL